MPSIVRLFDESLDFLERKQRRNDHLAVRRKSEFIGRVELDPIRTVHQLFADGFADFPR